jgi:hypothetical protein
MKTGKLIWRVKPEWEETFTVDGTERKERL